MLSSFPECTARPAFCGALLGLLVAGALVPAAHAAQTYWQPQFEIRGEDSSNRNLAIDPANQADVTGFIAEAQLTWGYVTPKNDTTVRPRIRFQRFPDREDIDRSEQFLDFTTRHRLTQRSSLDLVGRYSREDTFNTELGDAEFDDLDPDDPTGGTPGGATSDLGKDTRTRTQVRPGFTHQFSNLTGIRLEGVAEAIRFDSDVIDRTSYDYFEMRGLVTRNFSPRTQWSVGPMVSRYETRDDRNTTDGYGLDLGVRTRWSDLSTITATVFVRETDAEIIDETTITSVSNTNFGADFGIVRETETGRIRGSIGRNVRPTTSGSVVLQDEIRLQYDHDFSQRLTLRTAIRAYTWESTSGEPSTTDRDYARGEIQLVWMMTPTYYLRGGYNYTWRNIDVQSDWTDNSTFFISLGYRGLGRPR
jgi:hypothetical protein